MRDTKIQAIWAALAVAALALLLLLAGCGRRIVTVPVERVRIEWRDSLRRDSVIIRERDSVVVDRYVKGDTVHVDRVITRWRDRESHSDASGVRVRVDSIPVVQEVIKEVPRHWVKDVRAAALWCCLPLVVAALALWLRRRIACK
ncbi:hypothetical protein [Porphyromonas sp. oral taxon 275]|uniref:hypothetical protein n=1 Tax=Porphyromonas sp. oral taxon 275 TaxID=712435 RepID=UPI001BA89A73|nr:hypothetical protein [Porphyromonas sp. oral taxon 275]QUB42257.1 hypothetical protein J4862_04380 [Porphyromonas sp. oral taxon 275]